MANDVSARDETTESGNAVGVRGGSASQRATQLPDSPRSDLPAYLPRPSDVNSVFVFDLLAAIFVAAGILAGLYLLESSYAVLFSTVPTPLELFVGNGTALIVVASILSVTIAMSIIHVRYMVAEPGDFRLLGIVGLVLILAIGVVIGYTLFEFYSGIDGFKTKFVAILSVQAILVLVTLYFSAMLKSELMQRTYEQTTSAAIAKLHALSKQGSSSIEDRSWLRHTLRRRQQELAELNRVYQAHLNQLGNASREMD